jgi:hypothetical protein
MRPCADPGAQKFVGRILNIPVNIFGHPTLGTGPKKGLGTVCRSVYNPAPLNSPFFVLTFAGNLCGGRAMRLIRLRRSMSLALILAASLASAGCPELNQQQEKATNPLFSVYDPAGRGRISATAGPVATRPADAESATPVEEIQGVPPREVGR